MNRLKYIRAVHILNCFGVIVSVHTSNAYGRITVTEDSIAQVAADVALDCYGIVDLVSKTFSDNLSDLFRRKRLSRGVNVFTNGGQNFH